MNTKTVEFHCIILAIKYIRDIICTLAITTILVTLTTCIIWLYFIDIVATFLLCHKDSQWHHNILNVNRNNNALMSYGSSSVRFCKVQQNNYYIIESSIWMTNSPIKPCILHNLVFIWRKQGAGAPPVLTVTL